MREDERRFSDDDLDLVTVEPLEAEDTLDGEESQNDGSGSAVAPEWTRRLSQRGKLARGAVIAALLLGALALMLSQTQFTLPPQVVRLLTPAPTATPRPGRLIASAWEEVSLPAAPGMRFSGFAADPRDGAHLLACLRPEYGADGQSVVGLVMLWESHDGGQGWARVATGPLTGADCGVEFAREGSGRVILTTYPAGEPQSGVLCAGHQFLLSDDRGASWRRVIPPAIPFSGELTSWCNISPTAHHLYLMIYAYQSDQQIRRTEMERSDDGGVTWVEAGAGLPNTENTDYQVSDTEETIYAMIYHQADFGTGNNGRTDLWRSRDVGIHWERLGTVGEDAGSVQFLTETRMGQPEAQLCHCLIGVGQGNSPPEFFTSPLLLSQDGATWKRLPNLPMPLLGRFQTGVYTPLGLTVDGRLVILGADPTVGVPTATIQHEVRAALRVWAWNIRAGRWEVSETPGICATSDQCSAYGAGTAAQVGLDGTPRGTYLFAVRYLPDSGASGLDVNRLYRLYVPSAR